MAPKGRRPFTFSLLDGDAALDALKPFQWWEVEGASLPCPVMLRLGQSGGRLVCTGLILATADSSAEVSSRTLRGIRLGEVLAHFDSWKDAGFLLGSLYDLVVATASPAPLRPRAGPKGLPDEHYKSLADAYRRLVVTQPRRPVQALQEEFPGLSEPTIRRHLQHARAKGWLGGAIPGKAGEQPAKKTTRRRKK